MHTNIPDFAFDILYNYNSAAYDKLAEGRWTVAYYGRITDDIENDGDTYCGHFYGRIFDGYYDNYLGIGIGANAYTRFNDHYYWAVQNYRSGDRTAAFTHLGMSLHYLCDIHAPHHAANITILNPSAHHSDYETWVDPFINNWKIYSTPTDTFNYTRTSTFEAMSQNFSDIARSKSGIICNSNYDSGESYNASYELVTKAQRSCAGILNRFYEDVKHD